MWDGLQEIWYTLKQNKLRTLLTAFGVFWGIFMLIIMLGAGRGMQNGVYDSFGSDVLDFMVIWSNTTSKPYQGMGVGRSIELKRDDLAAIKQQIPNIRYISTQKQRGGQTITYENKLAITAVFGVPDTYFNIKESIPFHLGRKLNAFDQKNGRKICALGRPVAEKLFTKSQDPIGKEIKVNGVVFMVVGVFFDKNNRGDDSERIYIPDTTFRNIYSGNETVGSIWVRPNPGVDGLMLEKDIIKLLKKRHRVAPDDKRGIQSFNMAEPAKKVNGLFIGINVFIWFVGLGTLAAGIVGISNIMIITVKERTREIGIRKALGATPINIVSTLLLESILVTSIAGILGMLLGVVLLEAVAYALQASNAKLTFFQNPSIDFSIAITAIILLVLVGGLAGLIPALKAARIMPIEAMRAD